MNMYYATKNATFNAINAIKFFAIPRGQGYVMVREQDNKIEFYPSILIFEQNIKNSDKFWRVKKITDFNSRHNFVAKKGAAYC